MGNFDAPYLKLLNDASVSSACPYVRTCRRVRKQQENCNYTRLSSTRYIPLFYQLDYNVFKAFAMNIYESLLSVEI